MAGNPVCNISKVRQNNTVFGFLNCLVKHQNQGWKDGYAGDYTEDNTLSHYHTKVKSQGKAHEA